MRKYRGFIGIMAALCLCAGSLTAAQAAGSVTGQASATVSGQTAGSMSGQAAGSVSGQAAGSVTGQVSATVLGQTAGSMSGQASATVTGQAAGSMADQAARDAVTGPGQKLLEAQVKAEQTKDSDTERSDQDQSTGAGAEEAAREQALISGLKAAQDTDQLVLAVGQGGYKVEVSYHEKGEDGQWKEVFSTPGVYGRNGGTFDKKEGDGKTPLGTYRFTQSFGLKEDPGSVLPFHAIQPDDYWVDDGDSQYYNQLVNTRNVRKDWKSAERMAASAPFYNYGLVLDYNSDCIPGKGSAIFLHCTQSDQDTGSAGCIRIPEELVKLLLKSLDSDAKIVIVSDPSQLKDQ